MPSTTASLTILVIEDNAPDLFLIEGMLRSSGVRINTIHSASRIDEALGLMQEHSYDLVLLDLSLPDSFGIDSFLKIKPFVLNIPVIILTGQAESAVAFEALQQGAQDYLVKGEFKNDLLAKSIQYSKERKEGEKKVRVSEKIKQRQIATAVLGAQEEERKSLGKELHDNINQILATAKLYISAGLQDKDSLIPMVTQSECYISEAMDEIRKLSRKLITPVFIESGLKHAIEDLVKDILGAKKISIVTDIERMEECRLSKLHKITVYRIIQEQLTNILKHAKASQVNIRIHLEEDTLILNITDDGIGFDTALERKGIGFTNIQSRAEICNGKMEIDSSAGKGCQLKVVIDINNVLSKQAA